MSHRILQSYLSSYSGYLFTNYESVVMVSEELTWTCLISYCTWGCLTIYLKSQVQYHIFSMMQSFPYSEKYCRHIVKWIYIIHDLLRYLIKCTLNISTYLIHNLFLCDLVWNDNVPNHCLGLCPPNLQLKVVLTVLASFIVKFCCIYISYKLFQYRKFLCQKKFTIGSLTMVTNLSTLFPIPSHLLNPASTL